MTNCYFIYISLNCEIASFDSDIYNANRFVVNKTTPQIVNFKSLFDLFLPFPPRDKNPTGAPLPEKVN